MTLLPFLIIALAPTATPTTAVSVETSATPSTTSATTTTAPERWILRHRPRQHDFHVGLFAGILAPARGLAVRDAGAPTGEFARVAPELGARIGYYPSRFFGLEGELGIAPTRFNDTRATLYTARAQAVLQLGFWRVVPFVSLGGGVLGVTSDAAAAGREAVPALNVGGGVKLHASERVVLRLDVRDVVTATATPGQPTHSAQALFAVALRFGAAPRPAPPPPIVDSDGDKIADADDWCSHEAGTDPHGCPYRDQDCDAVKDNVDTCPAVPGVAPDGCPPPDADKDGVLDANDTCPAEAGPAPAGCPDSDGDGLVAPADQCPTAAETVNGVADSDGCPDELPAEVQRFRGVIEGIRFDNNRATIREESRPLLDQAAATLRSHEALRLEISGHTDNRGKREKNLALSLARADAVKAYLVAKGVAAERLRSLGIGPDAPIADNKTREGQAANRRIEFRIFHD